MFSLYLDVTENCILQRSYFLHFTVKMVKAEVQMPEEKRPKKFRPTNQLAEWLKWPKTGNSDKISKNTPKV
jgi:hypothetical protein